MKKKKTKVRFYQLVGGVRLKGNIIKNGVDTSRLVNLIICFDSPDDFKDSLSPPNIFFIHEISFREAVGILINKFKYKPKPAISKVRMWKSIFQTNEIKRDKNSKEYEIIVENINKQIIKEKGEDYKIGKLDIKIIAGFKQNNINLVHVKDKGFEETCKRLEISVILTPKRDIKKENEIKKKLNRV